MPDIEIPTVSRKIRSNHHGLLFKIPGRQIECSFQITSCRRNIVLLTDSLPRDLGEPIGIEAIVCTEGIEIKNDGGCVATCSIAQPLRGERSVLCFG